MSDEPLHVTEGWRRLRFAEEERDRLRSEVDSLKRILASSVLPLVTTDGTSMVVDSVGGVATDSEGMPEYVVIRRTDADGRTVVRKYVSAAERDRLKAENARLRNHLRACKAMAEDQLRMHQRAGEASDFGLIGRLHGIINECAALKGSDK